MAFFRQLRLKGKLSRIFDPLFLLAQAQEVIHMRTTKDDIKKDFWPSCGSSKKCLFRGPNLNPEKQLWRHQGKNLSIDLTEAFWTKPDQIWPIF